MLIHWISLGNVVLIGNNIAINSLSRNKPGIYIDLTQLGDNYLLEGNIYVTLAMKSDEDAMAKIINAIEYLIDSSKEYASSIAKDLDLYLYHQGFFGVDVTSLSEWINDSILRKLTSYKIVDLGKLIDGTIEELMEVADAIRRGSFCISNASRLGGVADIGGVPTEVIIPSMEGGIRMDDVASKLGLNLITGHYYELVKKLLRATFDSLYWRVVPIVVRIFSCGDLEVLSEYISIIRDEIRSGILPNIAGDHVIRNLLNALGTMMNTVVERGRDFVDVAIKLIKISEEMMTYWPSTETRDYKAFLNDLANMDESTFDSLHKLLSGELRVNDLTYIMSWHGGGIFAVSDDLNLYYIDVPWYPIQSKVDNVRIIRDEIKTPSRFAKRVLDIISESEPKKMSYNDFNKLDGYVQRYLMTRFPELSVIL